MPYLGLNLIFFYVSTLMNYVPKGYSKILDWVKYGFFYLDGTGGPGMEFLSMTTVIIIIAICGWKMARDVKNTEEREEPLNDILKNEQWLAKMSKHSTFI